MKPVISPDISVLDFAVILDLSGEVPKARVINQSTMDNPGNLSWAFVFTTPSGYVVHAGDIENPDITGGDDFNTYEVTEEIPLIFGLAEYSSSSKYSMKVIVKDSNENVFEYEKGGSICKPNGNNGKNNFGAASIDIEVLCGDGRLKIMDRTNLVYKGLSGTKVSTVVTTTYPKDRTGNTLSPITVNSLPALVKIKYEGYGHNVYADHVWAYDLGDGFYVWIRYTFRKTFGVWCNIDLCAIFCEMDKMLHLLDKNCDVNERAEHDRKINKINALLVKALAGKFQPLCGIDVPKVVEEIKEVGGFTCDCCRPQGIFDTKNILTADANFTTNKICGDTNLEWSTDDQGNIVLNYQTFIYKIVMCPDQEEKENTKAFTFYEGTNGCTKTTCLFVDKTVLAEEIVDEIINNPTLITYLNQVLSGGGGTGSGTCNGLNTHGLFGNAGLCNYAASIFVGDRVMFNINHVTIEGENFSAPANLNVTDDVAVQNWLNSLSKGVYAAVYSSDGISGTLIITSNNNGFSPTSISYINPNVQAESLRTVLFIGNCGLICTVLQNILNYLHTLNLLQVQIGGTIKVCSLGPKGQLIETEFPADANSFDLVKALSASICSIAKLLSGNGGILSGKLISDSFGEFTPQTGDPAAEDVIFGMINGKVVKIPFKNVGKGIFTLLGYDADVKGIFCGVSKCNNVADCTSVTGLTSSVGATTATFNWNVVLGAIGYRWSKDGVSWSFAGTTAANVTGLLPSTAYTFRVYPVYNSGDGADCVVSQNFNTTAGSPCAAPTNIQIDEVGPETAHVSWDQVTGASGYQYQLNGGAWINVGTALEQYFTGLTPNTLYNIQIRALISGVPCPDLLTDSFTTLIAGEFRIENVNTPPTEITAVSPNTWFTGISLPVTGGTDEVGTITGPNAAAISITLAGGTGTIALFVNGVRVDCKAGVIGVNTFEPVSFTEDDNVYILVDDSYGCGA